MKSPSPGLDPSEINSAAQVVSNMKFRCHPGRAALEDVRQLPSIWTAKPKANIAEALESFHTFADMKARKAQSARRPQSRQSYPLGAEVALPANMARAQTPRETGSRFSMYAT